MVAQWYKKEVHTTSTFKTSHLNICISVWTHLWQW